MPLTPEQIKQLQDQASEARTKLSGSGRQKPAKPLDGANRYRILPHWETKSPLTFEVFRTYGQHFVHSPAKNSEGSTLAAVTLCQRSTYRQHCPVCEAYFNNYKRTDLSQEAQALIKQANAGTKWLVNALHINSADPHQPIVLELPWRVGEALFGNTKTGAQGMIIQYLSMRQASMLDLNEGSDIVIRRSGVGRNTSYSVEWPSEPSQPIPESVLENLTDLDQYIANWQHSPEDEAKAVEAIEAIANGGVGNNAALSAGMGGPALEPQQSAPSAGASPAFVQPQAPAPQPQQAPAPQPQQPPQAPAQPPAPDAPFDPDSSLPGSSQQSAPQASSSDIDSILAGLGG